jgi:hypothetical protein
MLKFKNDIENNASVATVASDDGYWVRDLNNFLFTSTASKTVLDGSLWTIPTGLSSGTGDDNYSAGYDSAELLPMLDSGETAFALTEPLTMQHEQHALMAGILPLTLRHFLGPDTSRRCSSLTPSSRKDQLNRPHLKTT